MSLVSDSFRFVYVRVPRTGSTTYVYHLKGAIPDLEMVAPQHAGADVIRAAVGDKWEEYFTYGFIRNPWDWFVSIFDSGVSATPGVQEAWQGKRITRMQRTNMDFDEFVRQRKTTPADWLGGVDRVFRFEDMKWDVKLSSAKGAPRDGYRDWYDDDLRDFVAQKCAREIQTGNYIF